MFEFPHFRHVEWINDRRPPKYDLAWSDIRPEWKGHIDTSFDPKMISASKPTGLDDLLAYLSDAYGADRSRTMLVNGCSEGNWLAFCSTIGPGSKVLIEKPIYTPLIEIPKTLGAKVTTIKRRAPDYRFDLSELEERVSSGCDLLVMQNHNNPTGRALMKADLQEIASILDRYKVPVLCDEVYRDYAMTFSSGGSRNAFPSMVELYDRAIVTSSVTKVYGASTLMNGWLIGPKRVINRARSIKIFTVPMVNSIANRIALDLLRNRHKVLPEYFSKIRKKEQLVSQWAAGRDDVHWSSPDGCAVGFLTYDHSIPSIDICDRLYNEKEVRVIPGTFFHNEHGFRISLAADYQILKDALLSMDDLFDTLDEPFE